MLQNWLFLQLTVDSDNFNYQQHRAPPNWHINVRRFLNDNLPQHWIGLTGPRDPALHSWPPTSAKTPYGFFLWGYVKERTYVPPLPCDIDELKNRVSAAVASVTEDTLRKV
ncbi:hypothetical protein J6590_074748 [Homalodisca vitripennis]|nr:hypothetical protein J6590_074748 [Homalodisca vitripennis]